jgi:polyisoprenoid-binding protein YceI
MHTLLSHGTVAVAWTLLVLGCDDPSKKAPAAVIAAAPSATPASVPVAVDPTRTAADGRETLEFTNATSRLQFIGSKVTGSHEGSFSRFGGTVRLARGNMEASSVNVVVDTDSLAVEPAKLQAHLKSADFFDAARFPKITFESTQVKPGGPAGATHTITGNLDMHGTVKSIAFPAIITIADNEVSAKSEFTIHRKDFGIVYPGMPNDLIREGVVVKLDVHAPRKHP